MLDALALATVVERAGNVVAVGHVDAAVAGLDHRRIVIAADALLLALDVAPALEGPALVLGNGHGEPVAAVGDVVVDRNPAAARELQDFQPGAGLDQVWMVAGDGPGGAEVLRLGNVGALWRRPVVAHEGQERAVAAKRERGLNAAASDDRLGERPTVAAVVAVRRGGETEAVRVEPQEQPLAAIRKRENDRMGPGEPADPPGQLVRGLLQVARGPRPGRLRGGRIRRAGKAKAAEVLVGLAGHQVVEVVAGLHVEHVLPVPHRRPRALEVGRHLDLHQGALPEIRLDRGPEQPQTVSASAHRLEQQGAVRVRKARRVGEQERLAPGFCAGAHPGAQDAHVVGCPLPRTVEPGHEQIAIRQLDEGGPVVVPVLEREDQLPHRTLGIRFPLGGCGQGGKSGERRKDQGQPDSSGGSSKGASRRPGRHE